MHLHSQIMLSYKQFLYEHRKIKQSITITEFWKYLKMVYKIELEIAKKNDKLTWQTFFENGIYRRLSISLKIYMIITKPISFRSDMGGGGEWGGGGIYHLDRICSFASDPELQLAHLFQLVLSSKCKLANQWGKHASIMLLDPGKIVPV